MRFAILITCLMLSTARGWAYGGLGDADPESPEVKEVLDFAFQKLESGSNSLFARKIVQVKDVKVQLVAGKSYTIVLVTGDTNCTRFDSGVVEETQDYCAFRDSNREQCTLVVWSKPWENFMELTKRECFLIKNNPVAPETITNQQPLLKRKSLRRPGDHRRELRRLQSTLHFETFVKKYNKVYSSNEEYLRRSKIFRENMKKVLFLRETERGTGEYGASQFADVSEDEFRKSYLGLKPKLKSDDIHWPAANIPDIPVPKSYDWRDFGAVTPVKNQGSCGSCWAFSVSGNIEGIWFRKAKKLVSLSEQELIDCDKRDSGCNGGLPENAYQSVIDLGGLETEKDYSYVGTDGTCKLNKSEIYGSIDRAVEVSKNETQMAQWLIYNGPISIGINANAMQFYMGGVSHPFKFLCSPKDLDHGVLIVGYGVHKYPIFKKVLPYWIIKNSWGKGWGEQGYYRLYRGDGSCGVNEMATSAIFGP